MPCERCYRRSPETRDVAALDAARQDAPRSRFPLLAYAWVAYADDPEHGTLYLEIAYGGAPEGAPGDEYLLGGIHEEAFELAVVMASAPRVRLADAIADGDTEDHRPQVASARTEARSGLWRV